MMNPKEAQLNIHESIEDVGVGQNKFEYDKNYYKSLLPIKTTPVYDTYWRFAKKRQDIFFNKLSGNNSPWTNDSILQKYKFTNAYRASDRVSQYLIKNVIYSDTYDPEDTFFRIILFKIFNKIETWELLQNEVGPISYKDFNYHQYNKVLYDAIKRGIKIYNAAYVMPPGKTTKAIRKKHMNHLKLLEMMMNDKVYEDILNVKSFQEVYDILISYPMIGKFLGYQFSIDLNYSEMINFSEDDFVIPGPGALSGISKCFIDTGGLTEIEIIKFMEKRQELEFERLCLDYKSLWGRRLTLVDCQNLFCEVDKYSRISHPKILGKYNRIKIKQKYRPSSRDKISYWYPPKWGLNDKIK